MSNKIEFVVLGDVKDLEKKLDGVDKSVSKVAKVSAAAFLGMTASAYGFVEAARQQEVAINALNQTLKNQGNYSDEVSKDLQKYASALQEASLFGDEVIIKAQAMIASFGFEGESLKSLTQATLDLAQAKGMDLVSAADLVAKSVGSSTNALSRYGIQLDGTAGSSERAASAVANINRLYGGQAKAATEGLGSTIVLKNAISDLAEEIGNALSPRVVKATEDIKGLVDFLKANPEFSKTAADALVLGIQITAATTALALMGKVITSTMVQAKALDSTVILMGNNLFTLRTALTAVGTVGAWAFVGWKAAETAKAIWDMVAATNALNSETAAQDAALQASLEARGLTIEEVNRAAAERAAAARQADIEAEVAHNAVKSTLLDEQLARYMEFQAQMQELSAIDLVNLQTKLENEKLVTEDFEKQKTNVIQNEIKARDALREADKSKQLAMISFAQQMTQAFGKESKAAFFILKALRIAEILVNSFAADMSIAAVWAWNPPVEAALMASNHMLTALSIAGVVGTAIAGFAVGTPKIPRDMIANVHKDEMIVPETFSDAIRSGDLTLSGGGEEAEQAGGGIVFDFRGTTFNGVTETFVRDIFTKAAEGMRSRILTPLPAV